MLYSHENKRMKRYTLRLALRRIASLKIREERKRWMMEEVFLKKKSPEHFFSPSTQFYTLSTCKKPSAIQGWSQVGLVS